MRRPVRAEQSEGATSFDARAVTRNPTIMALFALVAVTLVAVGFFVGRWAIAAIVPGPSVPSAATARSASPRASSAATSGSAALVVTGSADAAPGDVEIPSVTGMRVDEALVVLQTSGLTVLVAAEETAAAIADERRVTSQMPLAGTVSSGDSTVTIVAPPLKVSPQGKKLAARQPEFVVCIDPGHQAHNDEKLEPIGPGSETMTPKATGGGTGSTSGVPEYTVALQISEGLKRELQAQGVRVVMTRTTNDVDISNASRAAIANRAHADLFIRVHCGASTIATDAGFTTLYPARNAWTAAIIARSRKAATLIEAAACRATRARRLGARGRAGVTGFNWSKVPTVMVEAGYLSNPIEDKLLVSPAYQDRVATGIAEGILTYLHGQVAQ